MPNCIGKSYADELFNISIIDIEMVTHLESGGNT